MCICATPAMLAAAASQRAARSTSNPALRAPTAGPSPVTTALLIGGGVLVLGGFALLARKYLGAALVALFTVQAIRLHDDDGMLNPEELKDRSDGIMDLIADGWFLRAARQLDDLEAEAGHPVEFRHPHYGWMKIRTFLEQETAVRLAADEPDRAEKLRRQIIIDIN